MSSYDVARHREIGSRASFFERFEREISTPQDYSAYVEVLQRRSWPEIVMCVGLLSRSGQPRSWRPGAINVVQ